MLTLIIIGAMGFGAWLLTTLVPMPQPWPRIIIGLAGFIVFILIVKMLLGRRRRGDPTLIDAAPRLPALGPFHRTPWAHMATPLAQAAWVVVVRGRWATQAGHVVGHLRESGEVLVSMQPTKELILHLRDDLTLSGHDHL